MSGSVIRVVLVDDQPLFRAGVRMVVDSQADLEVVAEADDGAAGAAAALEHRADVVLMDLRMPGVDGIEATRRILTRPASAAAPPPRVIVLTTFDFDEAAARAIRAGASGFVLKDADPEFLLSAIRTVHAGDAVVSAAAVRELFEHVGTAPAAGRVSPVFAARGSLRALTAREKEIFALAARGLSNAEIAAAEFLSEATVKTHVSRVLGKLELRDRVQLVVFAHEHGLV
ncbi:response regulator transcription factor [Herbiconiux sp. CPCC 203407]|uniref:Response regulator transcription factor n=1 Tax=Herbiconiux oxytropis TaxID=2970915 RepID=A0AA41XGW4_9MICO|nr:response regulator transcription factor [Herbiconiux oxytropis]MCS5721932.1 response regulator transcription factor [Herbiconiux oxytropis]MCS5725515.1 response regulator transcription factor [Herbiconiux oxytropis]